MDMIPGLILATILGLGWGSFATMAIYRLPHGQPWIGKKPFCPKCGHDLGFRDYVSVISFLSRRGECRYCGAKYGRRGLYLFTEIATTLVFIFAFIALNFSEEFLMVTGLGTALVILAVIDWEHHLLHPKVLLVMCMLAIAHRAAMDGDVYGILMGGGVAALLGLLIRHIVFAMRGKFSDSLDYLRYTETGRFEGKGFDYVILLTIAGIWLPFSVLLSVLVAGLLLAVVYKLLTGKSWFSFWFAVCWITALLANDALIQRLTFF